ncbi:MAG: hypothetical protein WC492_05265 [Candidatus Micrarchaeia archaeon]
MGFESLEKQIRNGIEPSAASDSNLAQGAIANAWATFLNSYTLQASAPDAAFINSLRGNLATYYLRYPIAAQMLEHSLELSIHSKIGGPYASNLYSSDMFTREYVICWSQMFRNLFCKNISGAANIALRQISSAIALNESHYSLIKDDIVSLFEKGEGTLLSPLNASDACSRAVLPFIRQVSISYSQLSSEGLLASQNLSLHESVMDAIKIANSRELEKTVVPYFEKRKKIIV